MSNHVYDTARYRFGTGALAWQSANLRLLAFRGTPDFVAADTAVSQIVARALSVLVQESQAITGKAVTTDGYLQTSGVVFTSVPVVGSLTSFMMILRGADVPTSIPLLFIDTAVNLPFITNGLDVVVQPDWLQNRAWGRV